MHSCLYEFFRDQGSLIGGVLALLAGVGVIVIGRKQITATQQTADRQIAAFNAALQAESAIKLMDKFDSKEFRDIREIAAKACLAHLDTKNPGADVEDVLDFFDDVAFWVQKKALDTEMMWHGFYHWVRLYCEAGEQHIIARTQKEPTVWNYLRSIYPTLNAMERDKIPKTYDEIITQAQLCEWLKEEIQNPSQR